MTTPYNVSAAIRAVIDETNLTEPADIAAKVAGDVPSNQLRRVLAEVLTDSARIELSRQRMTVIGGGGKSNAARSSKVAAIRGAAEEWRKALRLRLNVGDHYEMLADCSYEHLVFAATERRALAAANAAAAERYERYAAAMESAGVDRFGDLPDDVLRVLLTDDGEVAA